MVQKCSFLLFFVAFFYTFSSEYTGVKIRILPKNSHVQNHIFQKITFFTKIASTKSSFSQKSHFQTLIVQFKSHFYQNSHYFKYHNQVRFCPSICRLILLQEDIWMQKSSFFVLFRTCIFVTCVSATCFDEKPKETTLENEKSLDKECSMLHMAFQGGAGQRATPLFLYHLPMTF